MESQSKNTNVEVDDFDEPLQPLPDEGLDRASVRSHRAARIDEFEAAAIRRPNSYGAMIGAGTADLQRIFERLSEAVSHQLDAEAPTLVECRSLEPTIRLLLRLREGVALDLAVQDQTDEYSSASSLKRPKPKGITLTPKSRSRDRSANDWM
jgi:hypothetical protein